MEQKNLFKIAKKIVKKETLRKIKKIKNAEEQKEDLTHSINSSLKQKLHDLEMRIKKLENQGKDVFFAKNKFLLVPSKIKHFQVEFDQKEFDKLVKLINDVEKEVENV